MSQGNLILALYAAFAGVLLCGGYVYKLIRDHLDELKQPKLNFDHKDHSREEEKTLVHSHWDSLQRFHRKRSPRYSKVTCPLKSAFS